MFVLYVLFNSCRARIIRVYRRRYNLRLHEACDFLFDFSTNSLLCTYYNIDEWNIYIIIVIQYIIMYGFSPVNSVSGDLCHLWNFPTTHGDEQFLYKNVALKSLCIYLQKTDRCSSANNLLVNFASLDNSISSLRAYKVVILFKFSFRMV